MQKTNKPEWIPDNAGKEYTSSIMPGISTVKNSHSVKQKSKLLDFTP